MATLALSLPVPADAIPEATGLRKKFLANYSRKEYLARLAETSVLPGNDDEYDPILEDEPVIPGPDIEWDPSYDTYRERVQRLSVNAASRPQQLPEGFPRAVVGPRVWEGSKITEKDHVMKLSDIDINEIRAALRYFKELPEDLSPDAVKQETFPLPSLSTKLAEVANNLHFGSGFQVLRGLDPSKFSPLDNLLIYLGITSHIAEERGVQDEVNKLIHVKDLGPTVPNSEMRQALYANKRQPFHTDNCDILAMYVQQRPLSGGTSKLASAATIYNDIASTRPDVIRTLAEDAWIFDKHQRPAFWRVRPILFNFNTHGPGFCYSRRPITGSPSSPRSQGVPPMTEEQAEALDMVHFTAEKHQLRMDLQVGDIQLVNNFAVFHARDAFVDGDTAMQKRHILRLWLRNDELAWDTPPALQRSWYHTYGDSKRMAGAQWAVYPGMERRRILSAKFTCS